MIIHHHSIYHENVSSSITSDMRSVLMNGLGEYGAPSLLFILKYLQLAKEFLVSADIDGLKQNSSIETHIPKDKNLSSPQTRHANISRI